ncbi:MAG: hypothetical protein JWN21_462 [Sphingomonas bacterium]|uniref:lasso peptide biosynthesis B2 protein n=1 Tax=Sphingomonas bacterium TaxID=1895847 RepID=UPI002620CAC3|nr:lasso peptide biosynthesis B2 protein [Sphingomonas bacterium]MDB5694919.1 hypothetical protein [Sphingomonas bacterium]
MTRPLRWRAAVHNADVLAEAGAALILASLAIRWLPFARVLALAGWQGAPRRVDAALARRARWAVDRLADVVPWRAVCFQRGLALHWILRRRGMASLLHYGVGREGDGVSAHVWVSLDGAVLIGAEEAALHPCLLVRPLPLPVDAPAT